MKAYKKGIRGEYELIHSFSSNGFSVIRSASSGGFLYPVDILAIKKGLVIAIESKVHQKKPKLEKVKLRQFSEWCERAGAMGFVAWRKGTEWLFLRLEDAEKNHYEDENWIGIDKILEIFG
jgi:Holliday junction resolvase